MKKEEFVQWALRRGLKQDAYGHMILTLPSGQVYRYKVQSISIRKEKRCTYSDGKNFWLHISSAYLKDLKLSADDKLIGLRR